MSKDSPREDTPNTQEGTAIGTPAGEGYLDKVQGEVLDQGEGPGGESMDVGGSAQHASDADNSQAIEVDRNAADIDPTEVEPKQVEPDTVIFVPRKDFEARVNQEEFQFRTDVPTRVTRDVANMLLEDKDRGYVRD